MAKTVKEVKDLKQGDKLELEDGTTATVREITKGFYINSKLIHFTNGLWSCLLNSDKITTL